MPLPIQHELVSELAPSRSETSQSELSIEGAKALSSPDSVSPDAGDKSRTEAPSDSESDALVIPSVWSNSDSDQNFAPPSDALEITPLKYDGAQPELLLAGYRKGNDSGATLDRREAGRIIQQAQENDGDAVWSRYHSEKMVGNNGKYGCASSVCGTLREAGVKDCDSPLVSQAVRQLKAHGWKSMEPAPGCVAYALGPNADRGATSHIGIYSGRGTVWHNHKGTWQHSPISSAFKDYGGKVKILCPSSSRTY